MNSSLQEHFYFYFTSLVRLALRKSFEFILEGIVIDFLVLKNYLNFQNLPGF